MKTRFILFQIFCVVLAFLILGAFKPKIPIRAVQSEELKLLNLINDYRSTLKLKRIPLDSALLRVAQAHVDDLTEHPPQNSTCNLHSWSPYGEWVSCCYTYDRSKAECMWSKPEEISGSKLLGFEIAAYAEPFISAEIALTGWKQSKKHHAIIAEENQWKGQNWKHIGVAIRGKYAVVWFGK